MSRQQITITIGARVFNASGERIGEVDGITGDMVNVSGQMIPLSAFTRADHTGHHVDTGARKASTGDMRNEATSTPDTFATEQELMDQSVEDARAIEPPPPATGTMANPVAGSGFTRSQPSGDNLLGDTTVSQPFEDLSGLDVDNPD